MSSKAPRHDGFFRGAATSTGTGQLEVQATQFDIAVGLKHGSPADAVRPPLLSEQDQRICERIPGSIKALFALPDGQVKVAAALKEHYKPEQIANVSDERRAWELCGLVFFNRRRFHQALPVFHALYEHMLDRQEQLADRDPAEAYVHKGLPLVWISDCHRELGHPVLAKRYLMLAACEDVIKDRGVIDPDNRGVYHRLVWYHGMTHDEVHTYQDQIRSAHEQARTHALFPEFILQEIGYRWMTEYPSAAEIGICVVNRHYVRSLRDRLGDPTGDTLNRLAHYLLACIPGVRASIKKIKRDKSDYDVVCAVDGPELDFRSHLGRYFVCECKDWKKPADLTAFAKFCRVLDSAKCRFGILFSTKGISGEHDLTGAKSEQLKVFHDRQIVVVVISEGDLKRVADGANFLTMLRGKYERVRLDIRG